MKKIHCLLILLITVVLTIISCKSELTQGNSKNIISNNEINYVPYYLKMYEADSLYLNDNFKECYQILDSLFKVYKPLNVTLYFEYENYIKSSVQLGIRKDYTKEIQRLIFEFGYKFENIRKDSVLSVALKNSKLDLKKAQKLEDEYVKKIDMDFRKQLYQMNADDQEIRNKKDYPNKKIDIGKIDKKHDSILKKYILKNGFPGDKQIGTFRKINKEDKPASLGAELLIHFVDDGSFEFYKDELIKYIKKGDCPPKTYAMMIDTWYINAKGHSYYYFINYDSGEWTKNGEKVKEINKRRKEIGLPSLEYEKLWYNKRIANN